MAGTPTPLHIWGIRLLTDVSPTCDLFRLSAAMQFYVTNRICPADNDGFEANPGCLEAKVSEAAGETTAKTEIHLGPEASSIFLMLTNRSSS